MIGWVNVFTDRDADLPGHGCALAAGDELGHEPHGGAAPLPGTHLALLPGLRSVNLKDER